MYLNKKIIIPLAMAFMLFISCEKEKYEEATLRCWVNGQRYVRYCPVLTSRPSCEQSISRTDSSLFLFARISENVNNHTFKIAFTAKPFTGVGTYILSRGNFTGEIYGRQIDSSNQAELNEVSYRDMGGSMEIIAYFHMATKEYQITNGRFVLNFNWK